MDERHIWTIFLCIWLAVFGAALGSFLDCAVSRWAAGRPWHTGRSRCDACGHTLAPPELVPVFSYLLRRGRCKYCGANIPPECLAAELAGALSLALAGLCFGPTPELGQWVVFAALLLALSLADGAKRVLPDSLLLLLAANRMIWVPLLRLPLWQTAKTTLLALAVPAALLALVLLAEKRAGRELMGGGDIKLLFALTLYLGWAQLLLALLAACLLGLLWAAATHRRRGAALPFGPFLSAGALLTVYFGGPVLGWYFALF